MVHHADRPDGWLSQPHFLPRSNPNIVVAPSGAFYLARPSLKQYSTMQYRSKDADATTMLPMGDDVVVVIAGYCGLYFSSSSVVGGRWSMTSGDG